MTNQQVLKATEAKWANVTSETYCDMHLACWIELHSFTSSPLAVMLSWHLRQLSCGLFKDIYQG